MVYGCVMQHSGYKKCLSLALYDRKNPGQLSSTLQYCAEVTIYIHIYLAGGGLSCTEQQKQSIEIQTENHLITIPIFLAVDDGGMTKTAQIEVMTCHLQVRAYLCAGLSLSVRVLCAPRIN